MDSKFETDIFLCICSDIKDIELMNISKYYLNLLNSWSEFRSLNKINRKEDILEQHIFGNSKIRYKRKALFLYNFSKSGFKAVNDIWDQNSETFVNSTEIFNRLRDKRNWIAEYSRIKASFSHELRIMLKSDNINKKKPKILDTKSQINYWMLISYTKSHDNYRMLISYTGQRHKLIIGC